MRFIFGTLQLGIKKPIQWGYRKHIASYGFGNVTFPIAFNNLGIGVLNGYISSNSYWTRSYYNLSKTGCALGYDQSACEYLCWGY